MKLFFILTLCFFIQRSSGQVIHTCTTAANEDCSINAGTLKIPDAYFSSGFSDLKIITFNNDLTEIGEQAFKSTQLATVAFPTTLKKIGIMAFQSITSLTSITLNEGLEEIGDDAFSYTRLITKLLLLTMV